MMGSWMEFLFWSITQKIYQPSHLFFNINLHNLSIYFIYPYI